MYYFVVEGCTLELALDLLLVLHSTIGFRKVRFLWFAILLVLWSCHFVWFVDFSDISISPGFPFPWVSISLGFHYPGFPFFVPLWLDCACL
ncbi:hypothetical protein B0I72DRAFT_44618 [Yarrowia lipolytica]|nr:hypothetical protein B0I72DRAFT_44618 [Yarrowia lipolytica]